MNLQVVNFQSTNVCSHIQSHNHTIHVSGAHRHVCASSTGRCAFVYSTGQLFMMFVDLRRQMRRPKGSSLTLSENLEVDLRKDNFTILLVVQQEKLTNEDLMESEPQRKDEERLEEKSPKNRRDSQPRELQGGFSLFEEALLAF